MSQKIASIEYIPSDFINRNRMSNIKNNGNSYDG